MTDIDYSNWVGDGSQGTIASSRDTISIASATTGTPFNARLDANIPSGDFYYEVSVEDLPEGSSLAVGLVARGKFQPGWKTRGYFYNGNISNGSAGLIIGFGRHLKSGDVVGVYFRRLNEGVFEVVFYHNKRCLGAGFSIKDSAYNELYPCLHVSGSATVKATPGTHPTVFVRDDTTTHSDDAYSGDWEIKRLLVGPELGEFPLPQGSRFKLTLNKGEGAQYALAVKIANTFSTTIELVGKMESFDSIKFLGQCTSTRKMPRPELRELEGLIGKRLNGGDNETNGFKKMIVSNNGILIISGPIVEMSCVRFAETYEPVTSID